MSGREVSSICDLIPCDNVVAQVPQVTKVAHSQPVYDSAYASGKWEAHLKSWAAMGDRVKNASRGELVVGTGLTCAILGAVVARRTYMSTGNTFLVKQSMWGKLNVGQWFMKGPWQHIHWLSKDVVQANMRPLLTASEQQSGSVVTAGGGGSSNNSVNVSSININDVKLTRDQYERLLIKF
jgi:hypothetical protein